MSRIIVDVMLPGGLAFIMFSLGLSLVPRDFMRVFARPRAVLVGLFGQIMMVPAVAFLIASQAGLSTELALGLVILAVCPGGVSSGLVTHLARGDTALSITLTALSSVVAVVSVPLIVDFALRHFTGNGMAVELPMGDLVRAVFLLTTVPVALGMVLRQRCPAWVARVETVATRVAVSLFVLIVLATFVSQRDSLALNLATIGPAAAVLNLSVMSAGYALARLAGLARADCIAITTECGLQNAALGIFIAASVLQAPGMTVASLSYALLMNVSAIALIFLMRRRVVVEAVS